MQMEVDATVLYAAGRDNFRKPGTGMWDYFVENLNGGVSPGTHALHTPKSKKQGNSFKCLWLNS
jgi:hypothetical protein